MNSRLKSKHEEEEGTAAVGAEERDAFALLHREIHVLEEHLRLGFGVRHAGFGFQVSGCGFRVPGFGMWIAGFGLRDEGLRIRLCGVWCMVLG